MEVELRPWKEADAPELARLCTGADRTYLTERMPFPYEKKDALSWLEMVQRSEGKSGVFRAIVADGRIIGNISVERKDDIYSHDGEIGYFVDRAFQRRGAASEAIRLICPLAFRQLGLLRITGLVLEPNTASQRVLERNGFRQEGLMRDAAVKNAKVLNVVVYGRTASQSQE